MSITDSFDPVGKPLITPAAAYRKSPYRLDVCVINFSQKIMDALTDDGVVELLEAERIRCVACYFPIYRVWRHEYRRCENDRRRAYHGDAHRGNKLCLFLP